MHIYLSLLLIAPPLLLGSYRPTATPQEPPSQQVDTAWVDDPRPRLESSVSTQIEEIWTSDRQAGTCFIGAVEEVDGRRVVRIRMATAAAFPERCTGFTRYVGASIFLRDGEDDGTEEEMEERARAAACSLLRDHPEWAVAASVYGFGRRLVSREGRVVEQTAGIKAWFCTWQRSEEDRQRAVPGDSIQDSIQGR